MKLWPFGGGARTDRVSVAGTALPEQKQSRTASMIALQVTGQPAWTPRDYRALSVEGFQRNAIVYRCVRMISEAAASLSFLLYDGRRDLDEHPLLQLLEEPQPGVSGTDLMESWYGYLMISGNAYLELVSVDGTPRELYALRPDRVKVVPGARGWPEAYDYSVGGRTVRIHGEGPQALPPVLHMRLFHPGDDHYGMSPLEAAAVAVDVHNGSAAWHKALLDNAARPSGALVYRGDGNLTTEQFDRLKHELAESYAGAGNAGRPLLLEGGLSWESLSLSPQEMDFLQAKHAAAREIALAFGVPPMLLGIPGDNTYANYREANLSFWRQTVLPLGRRTARAFSRFLAPRYGGKLRLDVDIDQVDALNSEREALWTRLKDADFLSDDEKRAAVGYGPLGDGAGGVDE